MQIKDILKDLVSPAIAEEKLELYDIQYRKEGKNFILRIFVDKNGGITLDDCERLSARVSRLLDEKNVIRNRYTLEVSSPGLDRPLKNERDFIRFMGENVSVRTYAPVECRRDFRGRVRGCADGILEIEEAGKSILIPLDAVAKANLEIEIREK